LADRDGAEREATAMAERVRARATEHASDTVVLGPAPPSIPRRADRWRWNVVLRGTDPRGLLDGGLEPPWSVDVDPDSLLGEKGPQARPHDPADNGAPQEDAMYDMQKPIDTNGHSDTGKPAADET